MIKKLFFPCLFLATEVGAFVFGIIVLIKHDAMSFMTGKDGWLFIALAVIFCLLIVKNIWIITSSIKERKKRIDAKDD